MSASASASPVAGTASRDLVRQVVVLVSSVIAIVGAFIGSGVFLGTPVQEASGGYLAADATLIAPGTGAFRIWSVIYAGMLAYAVWQALPAQRHDERQRRIGWWVVASLVLNAVWIGVVQVGQLALSLLVIVALLAVLCRLFALLRDSAPKNRFEAVVADGSIGLYLGWVIIATAANTTAVLVAGGFEGFGLAPEAWAVVVLAAAAAVGVALALWDRGRIAPTLSLSWGICWVAVARLTDEPYSPVTAYAAIGAAALVIAATAFARVRHERRVA
ncbi:MFS family permease [Microbacterium terrae]|uniref:TspO/MBR family protein n=1 Tax=Microbacterium terrae TaxID=69369 RepID=A0A0M2HF00_9MICO|nr:TspO/MBR family protein [Microbacterium terrae]KJL43296.1 TspO/MBR family protein [Microbacterium terrae]MBP1078499.1 MFS family permease [Microbacterium terrae]GLJ97900.1 tryptophan-rich sensory protein [Microbacterium terrae]